MGREAITKSADILNDKLVFDDVNILAKLENDVDFGDSAVMMMTGVQWQKLWVRRTVRRTKKATLMIF